MCPGFAEMAEDGQEDGGAVAMGLTITVKELVAFVDEGGEELGCQCCKPRRRSDETRALVVWGLLVCRMPHIH